MATPHTNVNASWANFIGEHFRRLDITPDVVQRTLIEQLQQVGDHLRAKASPPRKSPLSKWLPRRHPSTQAPCGVYLWGGVGSGKTLILEAFHRFLPHAKKQGFHFHRFMRMVHERRRAVDGADPLQAVARDFRDHAVFLDEFLVNDIGDAMLLGGLLEAMQANNVVLLITSNTPPDALYEGGLQRERFLPTIDLIESQFAVMQLNSPTDHRMHLLRSLGTYHTPCDGGAAAAMRDQMNALGGDNVQDGGEVIVNGRPIPTIRLANAAAWFSFGALCETARAASDYIQIARDRSTMLLSGVPQMDGRDDIARRFIHLIDVVYDHRVKLVVSADVPAAQLYRDGRLRDEFKRTISRLTEINSEEYLSSLHKPRGC